MTDLGILLAWSALQATLLALAAAAAYPFAARHRPAAGAAVAAASLGGVVVLTLLALCPLPAWWGWRAADATAAAPAAEAAPAEPSPAAAPTAPDTAEASTASPAWQGPGRAVAPFRDRSESGWEIVTIVFLSGAALCLLRLGVGLWAVSDLCRRSRPIADPSPHRLMDQLRKEMGCRCAVDLRESPRLGAPAVVGWLRPVVLVPADWRGWSDSERRAVLAHELAHVRRSDYLLGLLARLGLALHFYHPLLYWLAGRLRLQQELAADALAAPFAGGRDAYLRGLARLALRLNDRRPAGWPANPLLSPGTLMRRIQMLKAKEGSFGRPTPRWGRALLAALLAVAVVGVSALRCTAQKAGESASIPELYQTPLLDAKELYQVSFLDSGTVDATAGDAAPGPFQVAFRGAGQEFKVDCSDNPVTIRCAAEPASYSAVFEKVLTVVADHGFDFAYTNRYDGRIETFPKTSRGLAGPRNGSAPAVRRRAEARVSVLDDGGYSIDVRVFKELALDPLGTEWTPLGRDRRMERSMTERLARFDPTCVPPAP